MIALRMLGLRVLVAPVWLAGASLLVTSLVASLPVVDAPRPGPTASLLVAGGVAAFLATVILAHELSRALMARARGTAPAEVRILTLGLPPGPETMPRSPASEAVIALTGPVVSGSLAAILLAVSLSWTATGPEVALALRWGFGWLGAGALVVVAVSLLPLLPLDGGRFVRALAWHLTGDHDRATDVTAAAGRAFGYAVLGAGILASFMGELLIGLWGLMLGWLATRVARASAERRRLEGLTAGLLVRDALDPDPPQVGPSLTLDALMVEAEHGDGPRVFPVIEDGRLVGTVFADRIPRRTRRRWPDQRAGDVMVPVDRLRALRLEDPLLEAVVRIEAARVPALPVAHDDDPTRLVGLVTRERVVERIRARQALRAGRAGQPGKAAHG